MEWTILDTGIHSAQDNMELDAHLLNTLDKHSLPILHFYDWSGDSVTYGHFIDPQKYVNLQKAKIKGLQLAKRPTGGGIVFHIWDFAFSVLIPASHPLFSENTLDNYGFVNRCVLDAVNRNSFELIPEDAKALDSACTHFCMARPTKYDVVLQGKKIAGAAQRKTKKGFLHQGTISLKMPDEDYLKEVLLPETKVLDAIKATTFPLLGQNDDLQEGRKEIKAKLIDQFTQESTYVTKT